MRIYRVFDALDSCVRGVHLVCALCNDFYRFVDDFLMHAYVASMHRDYRDFVLEISRFGMHGFRCC